MEKLYAPWRHTYVSKQDKSRVDKHLLKNGCVFCQKFEEANDRNNLVVKRFERCAVVMNSYPYSAGHLMILPFEHSATLDTLPAATRHEIIDVAAHAVIVLEQALKCEGHNVGINLGKAGGGGLPSHLHMHILPRWLGDTNFLTTTAETGLICSPFDEIYTLLHAAFSNVIF